MEEEIDSAKVRLTEIKSLLPDVDATHENQVSRFYDLLYGEVLFAEDSLEKAITVSRQAESLLRIPAMEVFDMAYYYNLPYLKEVLARAYQKKGDLNKAIVEYIYRTESVGDIDVEETMLFAELWETVVEVKGAVA